MERYHCLHVHFEYLRRDWIVHHKIHFNSQRTAQCSLPTTFHARIEYLWCIISSSSRFYGPFDGNPHQEADSTNHSTEDPYQEEDDGKELIRTSWTQRHAASQDTYLITKIAYR